ncbi:MAG: sensor histidine kinase [Anaerolineae bacterium]|nr:sensor histidine kinase [Anaerolineae bacterium]
MMDNQSFDDPREELISTISTEMGRIRDALSEIKVQIEQTEKVVNTEQQRNADLATELRTVQDNLDTIPRQDIRAKYDEALDARFRLSTMRGQLEKFQANRETMEQNQLLLSKLLNKIQGVDVFHEEDDGDIVAGTPVTAVNIVRIVQAQEEERQRLARQMHDGPAQSLTNFILQAEICQRLFDRNPERAAEELDNLKNSAGITFQKVRDFIFDLRPMMLDDLGVVPTVRRYVESFNEKSGIETSLELLGEERRLETHREVMIFRGIQELLVNARDYAAPSKISIRLDMGVERIRADIEDNGRGFDAEAALSPMQDAHADPRVQSIITLKETFDLVGGSLTITSSETEGTSARLELPAESNRF